MFGDSTFAQKALLSSWHMCYSAQVRASYKKYVREWGADVSLKQFFRLYWLRSQGAKIKIAEGNGCGVLGAGRRTTSARSRR